jgi:hypothetical protein
VIVTLAAREIAAFAEFADFAYRTVKASEGREAREVYFYVHSFLAHSSTIAQLLWSKPLAEEEGRQQLAEILEVSADLQLSGPTVRKMIKRHDRWLVNALERRGESAKILDYNIGDRDAFEEEDTYFLRHYDPTVDTLTMFEEEINLARLAAEVSEVKERAETWLASNAMLADRPAEISIPPRD